MDRTTRKTLTMYGALHQKSGIDRLYVKRKHGGRGPISIEMCVRSMEYDLGLCVRGSNEILLKSAKKSALSKLKILWKQKTSRKIANMSLEINSTKRECMDSLFVKCLKNNIEVYLENGWCKVISKCKLKQRYVLTRASNKDKFYK